MQEGGARSASLFFYLTVSSPRWFPVASMTCHCKRVTALTTISALCSGDRERWKLLEFIPKIKYFSASYCGAGGGKSSLSNKLYCYRWLWGKTPNLLYCFITVRKNQWLISAPVYVLAWWPLTFVYLHTCPGCTALHWPACCQFALVTFFKISKHVFIMCFFFLNISHTFTCYFNSSQFWQINLWIPEYSLKQLDITNSKLWKWN